MPKIKRKVADKAKNVEFYENELTGNNKVVHHDLRVCGAAFGFLLGVRLLFDVQDAELEHRPSGIVGRAPLLEVEFARAVWVPSRCVLPSSHPIHGPSSRTQCLPVRSSPYAHLLLSDYGTVGGSPGGVVPATGYCRLRKAVLLSQKKREGIGDY